jgi:hypothetical protein
MTITIQIDDSVASELIQNVGLAMGLNEVTDEEARMALGEDFKRQIRARAVQGQTIRERKKETESTEVANKLIQVS